MSATNQSWRMLLPHDGMIGMSPQVGRVSVPMAGITRLRTSDGRRGPALRGVWSEGGRSLYVLLVPYDGRVSRMMRDVNRGDVIEFVGMSGERRDAGGDTHYAVVVHDMNVVRTNASRMEGGN